MNLAIARRSVLSPVYSSSQAGRLLAAAVATQANVLASGWISGDCIGAVFCLLLVAIMTRGRPLLF
jgi:hypothetical protein